MPKMIYNDNYVTDSETGEIIVFDRAVLEDNSIYLLENDDESAILILVNLDLEKVIIEDGELERKTSVKDVIEFMGGLMEGYNDE